jgi:hypothetical protein
MEVKHIGRETSECFNRVQRSVVTVAIASRRARVGIAVK